MSSETIQWISVAVVVAFALGWIIRRIDNRRRCSRRGTTCNSGGSSADPCSGCELADHCRSSRHR